MYSEGQVENLAINAVNDGLAQGGVVNAVAIMGAPASTTLTDAEIAKIIGGVFINGTFLGFLNPVLFTAAVFPTYYFGLFMSAQQFRAYYIDRSTKIITLRTANEAWFNLGSIQTFNGKTIPSFPTADGKTYIIKYINGVLTWVEEII